MLRKKIFSTYRKKNYIYYIIEKKTYKIHTLRCLKKKLKKNNKIVLFSSMPFQGQKEDPSASSTPSCGQQSPPLGVNRTDLLQESLFESDDSSKSETLEIKYGIKECYVRLEELHSLEEAHPIQSLLEQIQLDSSSESENSVMAVDSPPTPEIHPVSVSVHRICSKCPPAVI